MDDPQPTLVAGYRLDRYELLSPIASGGMASVWLARMRGKRGFEKLFAIKTIKTELTEDVRFQQMFLDEARIASGIHHPNVAQILDLGEQDDVLYIVMEWVDADSLSTIRRLAKKAGAPVPIGAALRVIAGACAGLHAAHELRDRQGQLLGVVHRDVSPQNILVSSAGSVKVIDFGVAKARDRLAGETATGIVKGKIRYMAPEQAHAHAVDRRADVWAVGVCLWELVTGQLPFDGDSDIDVLRRLMSAEPAPPLDGALPDAVREVLERSLARDPESRFATAAAMERAIEKAIDALGQPATGDDVAEFLRGTLPELETKRHEAVSRALAAAEARETGGADAPPSAAADPALAPTMVSKPGTPPSAAEPKTVIKKKPSAAKRKRPRAEASASRAEDSKVTATAASVPEPIPPKRRSNAWWGAVLVAVGAGAWFGWPGGARLRSMIGSDAPPEPMTPPSRPSPAVAAPPPARIPASAPPVATASAAPTPPATVPPPASAQPSAGAPASARAPAPPADAGRRRRARPAPSATTSTTDEPMDDTPYNE